jgi:hypothetical protein
MHVRAGRRLAVLGITSLLLAAQGSVALAAPRSPVSGSLHGRYRGAMGLVPVAGRSDPVAGLPAIDTVYHGGPVMHAPVTVHTVFWAPPGYSFTGSPGTYPASSRLLGLLPGTPIPGYQALQQQFFVDVAHDSGSSSNAFSVLGQYPDSSGAGAYGIRYSPAADSIVDTNPYPSAKGQCVSPAGTTACLTDSTIGRELDKVISRTDPGGRGFHDVWMVYLPPGVDECYQVGVCGTNSYGGYHSVSNVGHGPVIYAVIIDPLIEVTPGSGSDPAGNPEAETAIDTSAHEVVEAITDPSGVGWMDPNGGEVGDKCESGPQIATPLGYAPNGAPYDQLINGNQYLVQAMWANAVHGCIDRTANVSAPPALPTISLRQFSSQVSGNVGSRKAGISVNLLMIRGGFDVVAAAFATTRSSGAWGPVSLLASGKQTVHGFGDDRDAIIVTYGKGGPKPDLIGTGSGGNPFIEAGWTGFYDLDTGFTVSSHSVSISPCGQVGVLALRVGRVSTPAVDVCGMESGIARVATKRIGLATAVSLSSTDNRAPSASNPAGALVNLTVALGEPGSIGLAANNSVPFLQSGLPSCTADLRSQSVICGGLVPGERYALTRRRGGAVRSARADLSGTVHLLPGPGVVYARGGDALTLRNPARRVLTVLHVAHLRVAIAGNQTVLASGTCEPGDYWGKPVTAPPVSKSVGVGGATGTGIICPPAGGAAGLPDAVIAQTDDRSGGTTRTAVPFLGALSPASDATVYGGLIALCQTYLPSATNGLYAGGTPVSLTITPVGSSTVAFHSGNVDVPAGVPVTGLTAGTVYHAKWVLRDLNGDTRTWVTRFVFAG